MLVDAMLDSGIADLWTCDKCGSRPLHLAAQYGMCGAAARIAGMILAAGTASAPVSPLALFYPAEQVGAALSAPGRPHLLDELDPVTGESVLNLLLARGQMELCCSLLDVGVRYESARDASSAFLCFLPPCSQTILLARLAPPPCLSCFCQTAQTPEGPLPHRSLRLRHSRAAQRHFIIWRCWLPHAVRCSAKPTRRPRAHPAPPASSALAAAAQNRPLSTTAR